jgi:hypothetical protein
MVLCSVFCWGQVFDNQSQLVEILAHLAERQSMDLGINFLGLLVRNQLGVFKNLLGERLADLGDQLSLKLLFWKCIDNINQAQNDVVLIANIRVD